MLIRRALGLFRRIRSPALFAAAAAAAHRSFTSSSTPSISSHHRFSSHSAWRKHHWDIVLGIVLSGQTAIFLGLSGNTVFAQDASVAELATENDQGEAYVTGLRRIEDGSVISNLHTSKWRIYTDNGRELFLKGKLDEAENYFRSALHEAKEGFGPRDPHVASSCNNLLCTVLPSSGMKFARSPPTKVNRLPYRITAELYRVRKVFEKAEPLYLEAINILEEAFGADDIRVGAALHNLGQFYLQQRKLEQAQRCYERALKIKGRVLGYGHIDYANTMYHLGTVLHLQGKERDSEALIQGSIRILEEGGLGESATCLRRMKYLSQILLNSDRLAEAESLHRKILHVLELSKGWDSMDTIIAAESLGLTLQSLGNLTEAQELLERCLAARRKILPQDHVQVAANMLHLARIAMLNVDNLRKLKISETRDELEKAKFLVDSSIRLAKAVLDHPRKNQNSLQSSSVPTESGKDRQLALIILLQSLNAVGLLEVTKCELQERGACEFPFEAVLALRECVSIYKEPHTRSVLLTSSEVRVEYLSCLKRLTNIISESTDESQKARELPELKDEVRRIESEISSKMAQRN